jgi:hypothetical protein
MSEALFPHHLHVYTLFSPPSYKACCPFPGPSGCLWQAEPVKLPTLPALCPQYLQQCHPDPSPSAAVHTERANIAVKTAVTHTLVHFKLFMFFLPLQLLQFKSV